MPSIIYIILFIALFLLIILIVLSIVASNISKRRTRDLVDEIVSESPFRRSDTKSFRPHNDMLARVRQEEQKRREELESNVSIYNPDGIEKSPVSETKIVGIVEPKGFWSKFIMSQKLSYIMARLHFQNSSKNAGFWTNLIKAQAASQGKGQGRGR